MIHIRVIFIIFILLFNSFAQELIVPIPSNIDWDIKKANLGKKLFFDTRLSKDNSLSCLSCHNIYDGGDDNKQLSTGVLGKKGKFNSPTVLNAKFNFVQFWNGRASSLKEQVLGPITSPLEMANTIPHLINTLNSIKEYKIDFENIYKDGITASNIADAIAEFEKTLITPNSRFDRYLLGDKKAITKDELQGYKLFKSKGCISCHHGVNVGSNLYAKIGIFHKYKTKDLGRYEVTQDPKDKYLFKVPSLRNISKTAPYFHNGNIKNLKKAIKIMAKYQLGQTLNNDQIDKIYKFLLTLDADLPKSFYE